VLFWQVAFLSARKFLQTYMSDNALCVAIAIFQLLPLWRDYLVGTGALYSDGLTAALLILAVCTVSRESTDLASALRAATVCGGALALATYLRGQYSLAALLLICIAGGFFLTRALQFVLGARRVGGVRSRRLKWSATQFAIIALTLIVAMSPFWIWRHLVDGGANLPEWSTGGRTTWTLTDAFAYEANWRREDQLAGFIAEGGHGAACIIEPSVCDLIHDEAAIGGGFDIYSGIPKTAREYQALVVSSILNNPWRWVQFKAPFFAEYFGSTYTVASPSSSSFIRLFIRVAGLVIAGLFIVRDAAMTGIAVAAVTSIATLGPPFVSHLEVRYLLLLIVLSEFALLTSVVHIGNCGSQRLLRLIKSDSRDQF
jgi:hypothetical protein